MLDDNQSESVQSSIRYLAFAPCGRETEEVERWDRVHPKANGCVEKFMQVINKSIKTAVYEQQNWRKALNITLLNYRTAAHATTEKSPALLFFGREINNKLPNIKTSTSQYDKEVRKRQASKFEKSKSRVDKARKAVVSDVKVGDIVILKRLKKGNKFDSKFYQRQFKVIEKKQIASRN